jgi:hypothetical protein
MTPKSPKEILDEEHQKMIKGWSRNSKILEKIFFIFKRFNSFFIKTFIFVFSVFIFFIIFQIITAPPKYPKSETEKKAAELDILINSKAGSSIPAFKSALEYLKKYPKYYDKVVNNIIDIEIKSGICPHACIYYSIYFSKDMGMLDLMVPEANFAKKTLVINPRGISRYDTEIKFASMLIHETDHVEYIESSKLRRMGLFIKCNPLLNPNISINSTLSSISHRVKTIEICAEKEQMEFHELTDTDSGFEAKNGIFNKLFKSIQIFILYIFYFFKSLFNF